MTVDRHRLEPSTTGLILFDLLECYRERVEGAGVIEPLRRLVSGCRARGVALFVARADHRSDGSDYNRSLTDTDSEHRPWPQGAEQPDRFGHPRSEMRTLSELEIGPEDYDVPKHRWSAFFQTHLDLSLRTRGIDTVLLVGGSTHVGVASTAYAARDLDYHVVVVSDACFGREPQRSFFLEQVFPRMARVRTVDEVLNMMPPGAWTGSSSE